MFKRELSTQWFGLSASIRENSTEIMSWYMWRRSIAEYAVWDYSIGGNWGIDNAVHTHTHTHKRRKGTPQNRLFH